MAIRISRRRNMMIKKGRESEIMIVKKQYLKSKPLCKVVFGIPSELADDAREAWLVGDFNRWDQIATPMKRLKNGSFSVTVDLETGREYQFRYLIDGNRWENAWNADKSVLTPYGDTYNSIVIV